MDLSRFRWACSRVETSDPAAKTASRPYPRAFSVALGTGQPANPNLCSPPLQGAGLAAGLAGPPHTPHCQAEAVVHASRLCTSPWGRPPPGLARRPPAADVGWQRAAQRWRGGGHGRGGAARPAQAAEPGCVPGGGGAAGARLQLRCGCCVRRARRAGAGSGAAGGAAHGGRAARRRAPRAGRPRRGQHPGGGQSEPPGSTGRRLRLPHARRRAGMPAAGVCQHGRGGGAERGGDARLGVHRGGVHGAGGQVGCRLCGWVGGCGWGECAEAMAAAGLQASNSAS